MKCFYPSLIRFKFIVGSGILININYERKGVVVHKIYPKIIPNPLTGNEVIVDPDGNTIANVNDFWSWAYSDLINNAERGALAEYIVACALKINDSIRIPWDRYDLKTKEGISVEVKTSGYIQSWDQTSLSKLIFGIQPTYGWDSTTNEYDNEKKRHADVYVFCVHKHTDQSTINPLEISQWDFYVITAARLNTVYRNQKSASLSSLIKSDAQLCKYTELNEMILSLINSD